MTTLKALTLHQPWASLVGLGKKQIETRSWYTDYRGPLAIHAGKFYPKENHDLRLSGFFLTNLNATPCHKLLGVILCTCTLTDCIEMTPDFIATVKEPERSFGHYEPGRFAWLLSDIKPLAEPIPARGYQRLWTYET